MSASLVGSEMCIRDRWVTLGLGEWACCRMPRLSTVLAGLGLACVGAVSYTHLTLPTICSV
eukprot:3624696-Alexandrium_andersonii.AAC.1